MDSCLLRVVGSAMDARKRKRKDEAAAAVAKGKLAKAAELYRRLILECPDDPQFLVRLGEVQRRRGRDAEAIAAFLGAATRFSRAGHLVRAIGAVKLVLEIDASHAGALALLAEFHEQRIGRPPGAGELSAGPARAFSLARTGHPLRPGEGLTPGPLAADPTAARGAPTAAAAAIDTASPHLENAMSPLDPRLRRAAGALAPESGTSDPAAPAALGRIPLVRAAISPGPRSAPLPPRPSAAPPAARVEPVPVIRFSEPAPPLPPERLDEILFQVGIDVSDFDPPVASRLPPIPLFADLDPDSLQRLLAGARRVLLGPGERAVTQGEAGSSFYVVVRGALEVVREQAGAPARLGVLEEGAFFGEMALLTGAPRSASVWAVEESELLQFTAAALRELVRERPAAATALRRFYRQRLLSNALATSPLFRRLDRAASASLIGRFLSREVAAGEVVVHEGVPVEGLFVVLHGSFEVTRMRDGTPQYLGEIREGELFGEASLLHGGPAGATCRARSRGMVLRLPREQFAEVASAWPEIRDYLESVDRERERRNRACA